MMKITHWLLVSIMCLIPSHAMAWDEDLYVQDELVSWVMDANKTVSEPQSRKIIGHVLTFSKERSLDPLWVLSIIRAESNFRSSVKNTYGAMGLMQVVPRWHKDKLAGRNPLNVSVNIEVGTKIMADCLAKMRAHKQRALACYSGGAGLRYQNKIASSHTELKQIVRTARLTPRVNQSLKTASSLDEIEKVWLSAKHVKVDDLGELIKVVMNPYAASFLK